MTKLIKKHIHTIEGVYTNELIEAFKKKVNALFKTNSKEFINLYNKYVIKNKNNYVSSAKELYYKNIDDYQVIDYGIFPPESKQDYRLSIELITFLDKYIFTTHKIKGSDTRIGVDKNNKDLYSIYFILDNKTHAKIYKKLLNNELLKELNFPNKPITLI